KPVYFDRNAISSTASLDANRSDLVKIVVNDGAIVDISGAGETVDVPADGYVIVMNKSTAASQLGKFSVGQRVGFTENETFVFRPEKSISSVELGVSGGGELLRNGETVENGLIISGRNPRTMIGVNKDKTKVYVVCIDGRGDSIGATHYEAAEVMADLGCYDAIHFDGGGSTTMVVENEDNQLYVANDPSEGTERRVANAFGVAGVGESKGLTHLKLDVNNEDKIMFAGFGTPVSVKGLDNNLNSTPLTQNVSYSANIKGEWNNNIFTPEQEGDCIITATAGSAEGSMKVKVLGGAASLGINIGSGSLDIGESTPVSAKVINKEGFEIAADNSMVNWSVDKNEVAYVQGGRVYGKGYGDAVVTAECNGASASVKITVGTQYASIMSFEAKRKVTASASGEGITGSAMQMSGVAIDGKRSIQIKYGFAGNMTTTQSVFAQLDKPVPVPAGARSLIFWYKGGADSCALKAIISDANDKSYGMIIDSTLMGQDWQKTVVPVPEAAVFPIRIEKFCVESLNTTEPISGTVYVDNIGAVIGGTAQAITNGFADPARGNFSAVGGEEITVFGQTKNGAKNEAFTDLLTRMRANSRAMVFVGASDISGADIVWQDKYETQETSYFSIVNLATSTGTLTVNGSEQLRYLRSYLNDMSKKNVIICTYKDFLSTTGIKSAREREAITDILKTAVLEHGKNIIVVSAAGSTSGVTLKDGIRYVNLAGLSESSLKYLRVKGDASGFKYEIE
ncbi:MAG: phosphodiester glycosidase family protein, partial [Firmicutes bacterium]|nr:phosphodiester glycosidase family protein [Bacillota bacterium]